MTDTINPDYIPKTDQPVDTAIQNLVQVNVDRPFERVLAIGVWPSGEAYVSMSSADFGKSFYDMEILRWALVAAANGKIGGI